MPGSVEMTFRVRLEPDHMDQEDQFHGLPIPGGFDVWGARERRVWWGYCGESRHRNPHNISVEKAVLRLEGSSSLLEELKKHLETSVSVEFYSHGPSFCCRFSPRALSFIREYGEDFSFRYDIKCKGYEGYGQEIRIEEEGDELLMKHVLALWEWDSLIAADRKSVEEIVRRYAELRSPGVAVGEEHLLSGLAARPLFLERFCDDMDKHSEDSDEFMGRAIETAFCSTTPCEFSEALVIRRTNGDTGGPSLSGNILSRMVERGVALNFALFFEPDYRKYSKRCKKARTSPSGSTCYETIEWWLE